MKPTPNTLRMCVKDLRTALTGLAKVTGRKCTLPVLGCLRCHLDPDKPDTVTLTGTDLDTFLELDVPASVITEGAPFLVPLADLRDALKSGGGSASANDTVILKSEPGDRAILIRETGNTPIPWAFTVPPVSEYPDTPPVTRPAFPLKEKDRDTLLQAFACSSPDPTRYVLQGACLEGGRRFVGTDGRHLYHGNSLQLPVTKTVILPYRKALDWKPLRDSGESGDGGDNGDWSMTIDGEWLRLAGDHWRLTTRLIDGNYPNWRQVVPPEEQFVSSAVFNGETIEQVAVTIGSLPGDKLSHKPVGLQLDGKGVHLLARENDNDSLAAIPVADATTSGPPVTVFLNRQYLVKALRFGLNRIDIIDHTSPMRLRQQYNKDREMIVMPVRDAAAVSAPVREAREAHESQTETKPKSISTSTSTPMNQDTHTRNNGGANGRHRPEPIETTSETTPLEAAVEQIATVKDLLRQAASGLTDLAATLKQAKTEQKSTEKEIRQVRSTIRTLQKVDL